MPRTFAFLRIFLFSVFVIHIVIRSVFSSIRAMIAYFAAQRNELSPKEFYDIIE